MVLGELSSAVATSNTCNNHLLLFVYSAYSVMYASGKVSLEHLLISRNPSQRGPASVVPHHAKLQD